MNRKLRVSFFLMLALGMGAAHMARASEESGVRGNILGFLGVKSLDHDDWDPVDDHLAYGVQSDFRGRSWPLSLAIDIIGSGDKRQKDGVNFTGATLEVDLGVRKL